MLPEADEAYLRSKGWSFEASVEAGMLCVVIHDYTLPVGFDRASTDLLQLARRLHEEHVREGMEKRDALIAEGHATAARVVSEAQQAQQVQLAGLEQEKQSLERKVDELRSFEKEYREKLRGYIEGQLRELESSNALTAGSGQTTVAAPELQPAQATAAPAGYTGPQSPDYAAYPQPTDYPGFAAGN